MADSIVKDLLVILGAGLLAAVIFRKLRVSVLIGYLLVGILIGDGLLGWVSEERRDIEHLAEAGVFMLLFTIGLEFSVKELWQLRRSVLIGGSVQMLAVAVPVGLLLTAIGFDFAAATLIALAVSFSSTVLVFKTLSEWGHSGLPHGRRSIGILLFQDAALIPMLLLVPLLTGEEESVSGLHYVKLAFTSIAFLIGIVLLRYMLSRWIIPAFASLRSAELLVLFTLVSLGGITLASYHIGLPPAIGAFAAGLVFSGNRWTHQIDALLLPFRETFAAIFFVSLGLLFNPQVLLSDPLLMACCLLGLVAIKAIAAMLAMRLTGMNRRTSIAMGFGLAHVGEFAFVLLSLGWKEGIISELDYQRILGLAMLSLVITPAVLTTALRRIGRDAEEGSGADHLPLPRGNMDTAVVLGAGTVGRQLAASLEIFGYDVCVVDLSPLNLQPFAQEGFRTVAGDATEDDTLDRAGVTEASLVVICVPDDVTAARLVGKVRRLDRTLKLITRCRYQSNVSRLYAEGADGVISEEAQVGKALFQAIGT
jgi:CPA2 family monovalent cation:H+ antiporter-2